MLMTCEYSGIRPILCFNKCDLDRDVAESYRDFYERCGYDVCLVSAGLERAWMHSMNDCRRR